MSDTTAGNTGGGQGKWSAFRLGEWTVEPSLNRVAMGDGSVRVRRQLIDLLVFLADRQGQVVSREEIFQAVWPGQFVTESALSRCVSQLRDVLGDDPKEPRFIETIAKRGYRLLPPVEWLDASLSTVPRPPAETSVPPDDSVPPGAEAEANPVARNLSATTQPVAGQEAAPGTARARRRRAWAVAAACLLVVASAIAVALAFRWSARPSLLRDQDTVLVSFENRTGERVFDDTLRLALTVQLEQSPYLRVVPSQQVREALVYMKRRPDDVVTPALAMDMCQRLGSRVVLTGSIAGLGGRYVIGLEGVECRTGAALARGQVEVGGKEGVLAALGQATSDIRRRLGESPASIQGHDVPLVQATTASLEALKALSAADLERGRGREAAATEAYLRAIEADPDFALAHGRLGVHLLSLGRNGEATEELKRAFALKNRASEGERLYITSSYYIQIVRDPLKAAEALEAWRNAYPRNAVPRISLAELYAVLGRYEEALVEARHGLRLQPDDATAATAVVDALMGLERLGEARQVAEKQIADGRGNVGTRLSLMLIAFAQDDEATMRAQLEAAAAAGAGESMVATQRASLALFGGRLHEGEQTWRQRAERAEARGDRALAALTTAGAAFHAALVGRTREARNLAAAALRGEKRPDAVIRAAFALALSGDTAGAEQRLAEYLRMDDVEPGSDPQYREPTRALIEIQHGRPDVAIDLLAPLKPYELGFAGVPTYVRGLAHLRAGRPRQAADEFGVITTHRGGLPNVLLYPLAWLQLARARAASADTEGARRAYQRFLAYWKNADPDLPVLLAARAELAALGR